MSALVWGAEWKTALALRRDLVLCVLIPLTLVLVIATGAAPAGARAALYTALFAGCGVFGTALSVLRDGERGMALRVVRGGVSPASYLMQRAAAGATLSLAQLLPALVVAAAFLGASASEALVALATLALTLWITGVMGVVVAALSRSRTEAVSFGVVGLLLLLHMSGVFHTPTPDGLGAPMEAASPFRALHEAFVTMVSGGGVGGIASEIVWALALPGLVAAFAPRLTASLQGR